MIKRNSQAGVGLIEVLVTIAVVSIGFFALLALQMRSLESAMNANQQLIATILVNELGERVKANKDNINNYDGLDTDKITAMAIADCPTELSAADSCIWALLLRDETQNLPGVRGQVNIVNGGNAIDVSISWLEKRRRTDNSANAQRFAYTLTVPIN